VKIHSSPLVAFYASLAIYLDSGETDYSYRKLMEAKRAANVDDKQFNGHYLESLHIMKQWNERLPGQALVEPSYSARERAFYFLRRAFRELSGLKRHESDAMQTYAVLVRSIVRTETEYITIFASKVVKRGPGATVLVHISEWDAFLKHLTKMHTFGQIDEGGMIIQVPPS